MESEIKTGVETKLRMRIRSTEHLVDPKRKYGSILLPRVTSQIADEIDLT